MFFGHLPEILGLLVIALLVFGPKRMIEMGSQLGKAVRELRDATKDLNLSNLMSGGDSEPSSQSTLSRLSQFSQSLNESTSAPAPSTPSAPVTTATATPIVEATVEPMDEAKLN